MLWGSGGTVPGIPNYGTRWRWVQQLYHPEIWAILLSPLDRKLGGTQGRSEVVAKRKGPAPAGNRTPIIQYVASHYTDWAIPTHPIRHNWVHEINLTLKDCVITIPDNHGTLGPPVETHRQVISDVPSRGKVTPSTHPRMVRAGSSEARSSGTVYRTAWEVRFVCIPTWPGGCLLQCQAGNKKEPVQFDRSSYFRLCDVC
jgi:hypothetical protein